MRGDGCDVTHVYINKNTFPDDETLFTRMYARSCVTLRVGELWGISCPSKCLHGVWAVDTPAHWLATGALDIPNQRSLMSVRCSVWIVAGPRYVAKIVGGDRMRVHEGGSIDCGDCLETETSKVCCLNLDVQCLNASLPTA